MLSIFTFKEEEGQVKRLVNDYITRHPCEFLNPAKQCCHKDDNDTNLNLKEYWLKLLTLKRSEFMKGWKPTTSQYDTLYDQLFYRYFEYPNETERYISRLSETHSFIWVPPHWFEQTEPLPSGRMGQVYLSQCRFPWKTKKLVVREINLCLILNGKLDSCPNEIIGITAIRSKQTCCRKLALVSLVSESTLEQLIPQVDQWTFQKLFRVALSLSSLARDAHKPHPNFQPNNIVLHQGQLTTIDDWPSIPSSAFYGRYPYIAPETAEGYPRTTKSIVYALGIMLWQLASGVVFPQSLPIQPSVYAITPLPYVDPAYEDLVVQCLQRDPHMRPSADTVCNALVRILMSEMACPSRLHQQHITAIQQRQTVVVKYLAAHHASKHDLQHVLYGASMARRMRVQVALSLDPLFHWQSTTKSKPPRRLSNSEEECSKTVRKKKAVRYEYIDHDENQTSCGYGADLPELMQMGFV